MQKLELNPEGQLPPHSKRYRREKLPERNFTEQEHDSPLARAVSWKTGCSVSTVLCSGRSWSSGHFLDPGLLLAFNIVDAFACLGKIGKASEGVLAPPSQPPCPLNVAFRTVL